MRIIGGKHRGTVLFEFKGKDIRPTADRTKEAVFNILRPIISGAKCLDLFCGTGNLGIEALSQGASSVVFTDRAKESVELTKRNLQKVNESASVFNTDALSFLSSTRGKFDIIFIDPPYIDDVSERALEVIRDKCILAENGVIVFERDKPAVCCKGLSVYDERKYGKAYISFIRKTKTCLFAGTFDPITVGHQEVIKQTLKKYDMVHLVIMKNENKQPRFSTEDRLEMLSLLYKKENRITVSSWDGMLIDYMRQQGITVNVRGVRNGEDFTYEKNMEQINREGYPEIEYDYVYTELPVSSTQVRTALNEGEDISFLVDKKVLKYIKNLDG